MLGVLRFLAGVGLGGAMPNAAALASEYVPRRQRPFAVTLTIVCIPLGGFVAARARRAHHPRLRLARAVHRRRHRPARAGRWCCGRCCPSRRATWRSRRERWPELTRLLRRIGPRRARRRELRRGRDAGRCPRSKASIGDLFAPCYLRDTVGLFGSFFFCLMVNYVAIQLVPAMLTRRAASRQPAASRGLHDGEIGGVIGAMLGALMIQRSARA